MLSPYVPIFIPNAETQIIFIDSVIYSFTLSLDFWKTNRKTVDTQLEYHFDIGIVQSIKSPKHLIKTHQSELRIGASNKANNIAVFDYLNVRKYHVDIDGARSPTDGFSIDNASNDHHDQYRDLDLFYKEYVGEKLLNPSISCTHMKNIILFK